jgi:hypothetical protein
MHCRANYAEPVTQAAPRKFFSAVAAICSGGSFCFDLIVGLSPTDDRMIGVLCRGLLRGDKGKPGASRGRKASGL